MAHQVQLDLLKQGVETWNTWREQHKTIHINLSEAPLGGMNLSGANLSGAHLHKTDLGGAHLHKTDLSDANLYEANLKGARLFETDLSGAQLSKAELSGALLNKADLSEANLSEANLSGANLSGADLTRANLSRTILIETILTKATLTRCSIYGISAWKVELEGAIQDSLVITPEDEPLITVDNLKVAQFIYLLLNNKEIRDVIETITSKVVLILGRFTPERKAILDALRNELRKRNYSPILFNFEKSASRDLTETVSILAHLARFIIVDLTDPSSAPYEVATIVPQTMVPVQPLLLREPLIVDGKAVERHEFAMFEDLRRRYHWVLPTFRYQDAAELLNSLKAQIIAPSEQKARELTQS